ncbi:11618_t:CDS:2, partial [Diversispora eburnea]
GRSKYQNYQLPPEFGRPSDTETWDEISEFAFQRPKFMFFYDKASLFRMAAGLGESVITEDIDLDMLESWIANNVKAKNK